jgi:hypothetical protein
MSGHHLAMMRFTDEPPPLPQRIALYELTRPERAAGLAGRRDF